MKLIQITTESIRTQASNVRRYKDEQRDIMKQIENLVNSLNEIWKGEAQDAYVEKFMSMRSTYNQLTEVLESYAKLMEKAADDMESADSELASMIRKIS